MKTPQPTNDEKRVRISEYLGWKWLHVTRRDGTTFVQFVSPENIDGCLRVVDGRGRIIDRPDKIGDEFKATPNWPTDLTAIQSAVAAQSVEFRDAFDDALMMRTRNGDAHICDLTAEDWCDCFIAVLDAQQEEAKRV